MNARGLTMIEALLASVILAALTAAVASVMADIRRSFPTNGDLLETDILAVAVPSLLEQASTPLRQWKVGHTDSVNGMVDDSRIHAFIERLDCPECPSQFGLFEIRSKNVAVHRFLPVSINH